MRQIAAVFAALVCCSINTAQAAQEQVIAVHADGSLQLSTTGKAQLADLYFPQPQAAQDWLTEHVLQKQFDVIALEENRYGRMRIIGDIQPQILRDGVAVIYASAPVPATWRHAEASARTANNGAWSGESLRLTPEQAAQHLGEFRIIEGTITRVYDSKKATYLNFGEQWQTDFSITIPAKLRRSMKAGLASYRPGTSIRVRGGIIDENGPMIVLTHAENLEKR